MGTGERARAGLRDPCLQALLAAQVPVDQVIAQAEVEGYLAEELRPLAEALLGRGRGGGAMAALFLLLGATERWQPFVPEALGLGIGGFEPRFHPRLPVLDARAWPMDEDAWEPFRDRVLERLARPMYPWCQAAAEDAAALVMPWLAMGPEPLPRAVPASPSAGTRPTDRGSACPAPPAAAKNG